MRTKILVLLSILSINVYAYGPKLEWNNSLEGGFGFTHVYKAFGSDWYGTKMPTNLMNVHISVSGIYFSGGMWVKNTGHSVYGYDEQVSTFDFQLGPSWRIKWDETKLTFTPYVGWLFYTVDDSSNNAIGQRQDYGLKESRFVIGGRIGFAYKHFIISAFGSNQECGVTLGINFDAD